MIALCGGKSRGELLLDHGERIRKIGLKPVQLFLCLGDCQSPCGADGLDRGASDRLPAVNRHVLSFFKCAVYRAQLGLVNAALFASFKLFLFTLFEKRDDPIHLRGAPGLDLIREPVAPSRTGRDGKSSPCRSWYPEQIGSHVLFYYASTGQRR
jgi:hypothetical protein